MTESAPIWPDRLTAYLESPADPTLADVLEVVDALWPYSRGEFTSSRGVTIPLSSIPRFIRAYLARLAEDQS